MGRHTSYVVQITSRDVFVAKAKATRARVEVVRFTTTTLEDVDGTLFFVPAIAFDYSMGFLDESVEPPIEGDYVDTHTLWTFREVIPADTQGKVSTTGTLYQALVEVVADQVVLKHRSNSP